MAIGNLKKVVFLPRFFIGYWILKRGWILSWPFYFFDHGWMDLKGFR